MAKLFFRHGCMGSSKSAELLIVAHNYESKGMNVLTLKHSADTRDAGVIRSRIGIERECILFNHAVDLLKLVTNQDDNIDCILVDESQFMSVHHVRQLWIIAVELDIPVICYGLKMDYRGHGFEASKELMILAHEVQEIKTICKCGSKATHHLLKINGEYVFEGNPKRIGDKEYETVCGKCFIKTKKENI